jgi:hypothetical protein
MRLTTIEIAKEHVKRGRRRESAARLYLKQTRALFEGLLFEHLVRIGQIGWGEGFQDVRS